MKFTIENVMALIMSGLFLFLMNYMAFVVGFDLIISWFVVFIDLVLIVTIIILVKINNKKEQYNFVEDYAG